MSLLTSVGRFVQLSARHTASLLAGEAEGKLTSVGRFAQLSARHTASLLAGDDKERLTSVGRFAQLSAPRKTSLLCPWQRGRRRMETQHLLQQKTRKQINNLLG